MMVPLTFNWNIVVVVVAAAAAVFVVAFAFCFSFSLCVMNCSAFKGPLSFVCKSMRTATGIQIL